MELLLRPRDEACRLVALAYLDEAVEARARLGQDPEALHDLRVGLRRFRSTLRAWKEQLGKPPARARKQLRALIDATSGARDAEVLLKLLAEEQATDGPLVEGLLGKKQEGYARVEAELERFPQLEARLRRRLASVELDLLHPHKLAHALAALIDDHADDVEDDLVELRSADQMEEAHAARISVKRLRYLVEPYKEDPAVEKLVKPCKALQDVLGDLHDTHLAMEVGAEMPELRSRLERRQGRLFAELEKEWLGQSKLVAQARALAADLRAR